MDFKNKEQLFYLLGFMDDYIEDLVYNVMNDSENDPHYSGVTASNLIKCYINVMTEFGNPPPFSNVKEYFIYNL